MRSRHDLEPDRLRPPSVEPRSRGTDSILALQRSAGNRAVTQLLARKAKTARSAPGAADDDLTWALDHVDTHYERVRAILELHDKVHEEAIKEAKDRLDLKDPPPITDAIFTAIFKEVVGLIPGGKLVTAAFSVSGAADELSKLATALSVHPGDIDEVREATQKKVGKVTGPIKATAGVVGAAVDAGKEVGKQSKAAHAQEAAIEEQAHLHENRIAQWTEQTERSFQQEQAIKDLLRAAGRHPQNRGRLEAMVQAWLPHPPLAVSLQKRLAEQYELALYRRKLTRVTEVQVWDGMAPNEQHRAKRTQTVELVDGGKPSKALLRRIAKLLGLTPFPEGFGGWPPSYVADKLGIESSVRSKYVGHRQNVRW